jgi:hypothetical protein
MVDEFQKKKKQRVPHEFCYMTLKKQVLNGLFRAEKAALGLFAVIITIHFILQRQFYSNVFNALVAG